MPSVRSALLHIPVARLLVAAEVLILARRHVLMLEPQERRRVLELVRQGHGRPSHLTERERRELARLVQKAEPREFVRAATKKAGIPLPGSAGSRKKS